VEDADIESLDLRQAIGGRGQCRNGVVLGFRPRTASGSRSATVVLNRMVFISGEMVIKKSLHGADIVKVRLEMRGEAAKIPSSNRWSQ
jgi:hypothetical protein